MLKREKFYIERLGQSPLKTSSRTTDEIIAEIEKRLSFYLIKPPTVHNVECKCEKCFEININARLNRIITEGGIE